LELGSPGPELGSGSVVLVVAMPVAAVVSSSGPVVSSELPGGSDGTQASTSTSGAQVASPRNLDVGTGQACADRGRGASPIVLVTAVDRASRAARRARPVATLRAPPPSPAPPCARSPADRSRRRASDRARRWCPPRRCAPPPRAAPAD